MADAINATIVVGGTLNLSELTTEQALSFDNFLSEFSELRPNWGGNKLGLMTIGSLRELLARSTDKRLTGSDEAAIRGEFPVIEKICQNLGLSYDRTSDPYGKFDGEMVFWRPGMTEPRMVLCNSNEDKILTENQVREVLKLLSVSSYEPKQVPRPAQRIKRATELAAWLLCDDVEPLPPLVIED